MDKTFKDEIWKNRILDQETKERIKMVIDQELDRIEDNLRKKFNLERRKP